MIINFTSASDVTQFLKQREEWKQQGLTVGATSGAFDVFIARHALSLEECKSRCDVLLVFLNSDASVKKYKGENRPINHETERAHLLASQRSVDHVVLFDDLTPLKLLSEIKPDIYFNLSEWGEDCIERHVLDSYGGKLDIFDVALPQHWTLSTTNLIKKINEVEASETVRAVFIDRDGVINDNKNGYIHQWEDIEILPGVEESLRELKNAGYKIIVITNQSGVGRGMYTENDVRSLHSNLLKHFEGKEIHIDAVYYCPHHPDDGCDCRKPQVGMLLRAVDEFNVNLSKSWLIGDSPTDIEAGRMANTKTIMIGNSGNYNSPIKPHYFFADLKQAVKIILGL